MLEVTAEKLPLKGAYDVITILEVFEHLYNPLKVIEHLTEHIKTGGRLWENYIKHDHAHAADLEAAQKQRPAVFEYLRANYRLERGAHEEQVPGASRCWRKV